MAERHISHAGSRPASIATPAGPRWRLHADPHLLADARGW